MMKECSLCQLIVVNVAVVRCKARQGSSCSKHRSSSMRDSGNDVGMLPLERPLVTRDTRDSGNDVGKQLVFARAKRHGMTVSSPYFPPTDCT